MAKVIIIMGVSGCGKTTVGNGLSQQLNIPFYDADNFHSLSNIEKMKNNIALTDTNRKPWLESLAIQIKQWSIGSGAILACSALKENYRKTLSSHFNNIEWIYLTGSFETILSRMQKRKGHYMKSKLLQSQFDVLEIPSYGLHISIEIDKEIIIAKIIEKLRAHV